MIGKPEGNHITDVTEIESLTALHVVEGWVWCRRNGGLVHSDALNPWGYIEDGEQDYCTPEDHRAMFMDSDNNIAAPRHA